ncbi:YciL protein [hydrothermal vent metagenome]|uniref:YciL protein n=1 Tax=hydrothermal vent metagenome TaxID=652676 RepID=A0A3B0TAM1_9ZZZZ
MLFAIITNDKNDALDIRLAARPDHLAYLDKLGQSLVFAGPFLDEDGQPNGSLVVIEAASLEQAKEIAAADPYKRAGLFESSNVRAWKWLLNNNEGR